MIHKCRFLARQGYTACNRGGYPLNEQTAYRITSYNVCYTKLLRIPFKVLEFGIYGDTYKHYGSKIEGNKTVIEVYMGKKLGIDYSIEVISVYKEDDKLIVIVEETEPEDYSNRIVVYPYEIIEVDGQYKNVGFKSN